MKILVIGDVVSSPGLNILKNHLRSINLENNIDFTIVNGENCAGVGIEPSHANQIFDAGADVITLGNHVFKKISIASYLEDNEYILRPCNMAPQNPGRGFGIYDILDKKMLLINLAGRCDMPFGMENPFLCVENILKKYKGLYDFVVCEIHANATSEKVAMGYFLDGIASVVYGTHTHVQTADLRINPKGTGYITDIGMTGPYYSVLGVQTAQSVALFRGDIPQRFKPADGPCIISGAVFKIDDSDYKCIGVKSIQIIK